MPMSKYTVYHMPHQHSMTCHHLDGFPDIAPFMVSHGDGLIDARPSVFEEHEADYLARLNDGQAGRGLSCS